MTQLTRAGLFKNGVYYYPVRVYYEDTDAVGVVYHANYLKFCERARTEMLRQLGVEQKLLRESSGISLVVRRCSIEYLAPAKLDDDLTVATQIISQSGAAVEFDQIIENSDIKLTQIKVQIACIGPNGRVQRLPAELRQLLATIQG